MNIRSVTVKNFRCFGSLDLEFQGALTLIEGANGSGKTSLLEALHYACYLRSFKTSHPKELITFQAPGFILDIALSGFDRMHITFAHNKRTVKLNQKPLSSFKELYSTYKVVTLTEDDVDMVKGSPSVRRSYLDQVLIMLDPSYARVLRTYKIVLDNRNALLARFNSDKDSYMIWTEQLWQLSCTITQKRKQALADLEKALQALACAMPALPTLPGLLSFTYDHARGLNVTDYADAHALLEHASYLYNLEVTYKRTLFGAHLDDFTILFQNTPSRTYASRGQQKLIVFLLKVAQLKVLHQNTMQLESMEPSTMTFLVDDFMTDFDQAKIDLLLPLLQTYASQVIITCPTGDSYLKHTLLAQKAQLITLL